MFLTELGPSRSQLLPIGLHLRGRNGDTGPEQPDVLCDGDGCCLSSSFLVGTDLWEPFLSGGLEAAPPRPFLLPDGRSTRQVCLFPYLLLRLCSAPAGWLRSGSGGAASQEAASTSQAPASCTACPHS